MKAMILAAGLGMRMRPLTLHTPKPLLLLQGKPLVGHLLEALASAGITEIVMNVSYLADKIQQTLQNGHDYGVNILYSFEPKPLETGGGIRQALPLLGEEPFLVISADIYTDYPLERLTQQCDASAYAHLIFVDNQAYHPNGDFFLDSSRVSMEGVSKLTYASCGIFHPRLFQSYDAQFFKLRDVLIPAIKKNLITGEHYQGQWYNVGTQEEFNRLNQLMREKQNGSF